MHVELAFRKSGRDRGFLVRLVALAFVATLLFRSIPVGPEANVRRGAPWLTQMASKAAPSHVIFVDVDNTLSDSLPRIHKHTYNASGNKCGISDSAFTSVEVLKDDALPGACEALNRLHSLPGIQVVVLTARPQFERAHETTAAWLRQKGCVAFPIVVVGSSAEKVARMSDRCAAMKCTLVDDLSFDHQYSQSALYMQTICRAHASGVRVVLFDGKFVTWGVVSREFALPTVDVLVRPHIEATGDDASLEAGAWAEAAAALGIRLTMDPAASALGFITPLRPILHTRHPTNAPIDVGAIALPTVANRVSLFGKPVSARAFVVVTSFAPLRVLKHEAHFISWFPHDKVPLTLLVDEIDQAASTNMSLPPGASLRKLVDDALRLWVPQFVATHPCSAGACSAGVHATLEIDFVFGESPVRAVPVALAGAARLYDVNEFVRAQKRKLLRGYLELVGVIPTPSWNLTATVERFTQDHCSNGVGVPTSEWFRTLERQVQGFEVLVDSPHVGPRRCVFTS